MGLKDAFKHAFAVDAPGSEKPTEAEQEAVDWVARQIAKRHLTVPGVLLCEISRPLNFVTSQLMHFAGPGAWAIFPKQTYQNYQHFARFLERRGSTEYLARRIEEFEARFEAQERQRRQDKSDNTSESSSDEKGP